MGVDMHPFFAINLRTLHNSNSLSRRELPESSGIENGEAVVTIETMDGVEAYLMELTFTVEGAEELMIEVTLTNGTKLSFDVSIYYNFTMVCLLFIQ